MQSHAHNWRGMWRNSFQERNSKRWLAPSHFFSVYDHCNLVLKVTKSNAETLPLNISSQFAEPFKTLLRIGEFHGA